MQSKIQEDELGPFEFHLFWALFLLVQCLQAFWQEAVQHTRRVAQDVVEEKYQQNKHRQAVFICVSIASCRVVARVSPLHKRIIVQACGCKHSGVFNSHPTFFRFFLRCQEFH